MPRAFDEAEESSVALLQRAGLPRASARCLACLLRGGGWTSADVAAAAGLQRAEVSAGMRDLVRRGAAEVEKVAREGKGRPALRHRALAGALEKAFASRRAELMAELAVLDEVASRFRG